MRKLLSLRACRFAALHALLTGETFLGGIERPLG
jgi:hypothetical protein